MKNNYPPGVTGNEPQIIGTGLEDKCAICIEEADDETTIKSLPNAVIDLKVMGPICADCLKAVLKEAGIDFEELVKYIKQKGN